MKVKDITDLGSKKAILNTEQCVTAIDLRLICADTGAPFKVFSNEFNNTFE